MIDWSPRINWSANNKAKLKTNIRQKKDMLQNLTQHQKTITKRLGKQQAWTFIQHQRSIRWCIGKVKATKEAYIYRQNQYNIICKLEGDFTKGRKSMCFENFIWVDDNQDISCKEWPITSNCKTEGRDEWRIMIRCKQPHNKGTWKRRCQSIHLYIYLPTPMMFSALVWEMNYVFLEIFMFGIILCSIL